MSDQSDGEDVRTWDDVLDGQPLDSPASDGLRKACAYAAGRALLPRDDMEDLYETLMGFVEPITHAEAVSLLNTLKMHERRPCDDYAPTQRALASWIRSFCDLSP